MSNSVTIRQQNKTLSCRNMKPNQTGFFPEMPFVSFCGKEINFISTADRYSSLCFKDISWQTNTLMYGGSLQQEFKPELLAYNPTSGRIYHPIMTHRHLRGSYGLLHPHICQRLGDSIIEKSKAKEEEDGGAEKKEEGAQHSYALQWEGFVHPLKEVADANDWLCE
jgi:hypothetical protein